MGLLLLLQVVLGVNPTSGAPLSLAVFAPSGFGHRLLPRSAFPSPSSLDAAAVLAATEPRRGRLLHPATIHILGISSPPPRLRSNPKVPTQSPPPPLREFAAAMDAAEGKMNSKRRRSHSPVEHKDGHTKQSESSGRKDNSRDLGNESGQARPGHEFVRHSDRHSYGASRESKRHDDYRRYHDRRADDNDRSHPRTSRSDRESRADTYYDRSKRDSTSDRSHGDWRNVDSRYGDKYVKREQRSKNQEKQEFPREYPRYDGGEYDKYTDLRKQTYSTRRHPEEKESKNKEIIKEEEALKKRNAKEIKKNSYITEPDVETREKRRSLFSSVGPDVENAQQMEKSDTSGKKPLLDCSGDCKPYSTPDEVLDNSASGIKEEGAINSVNAAKVAAMKAAELVNKNIVGFGVGTGRLSTEQKKKLLWGNKKSNPSETSAHWDSNLFSDRERQEKFNKLMGVKSSASAPVQESKADDKEGSSADAKKREELDTDLEKHYIAGLRRKDGRTVGLGL